jgi:hypothetical protein
VKILDLAEIWKAKKAIKKASKTFVRRDSMLIGTVCAIESEKQIGTTFGGWSGLFLIAKTNIN